MPVKALAPILPLLALLCALVSGPAFSQSVSTSNDYTLGSGDIIQVLVYGEDDLSVETQLNDNGILSYPFLGDIRVKGMTVSELQNTIIKGLKGDYLIDPRVSVMILQYRQFYINGEVTRPGGFPFQPGLTVRKAVSLAQGFTERAAKRNIFIISDNDPLQNPRRVELNSPVQPGDIITVEQSFF